MHFIIQQSKQLSRVRARGSMLDTLNSRSTVHGGSQDLSTQHNTNPSLGGCFDSLSLSPKYELGVLLSPILDCITQKKHMSTRDGSDQHKKSIPCYSSIKCFVRPSRNPKAKKSKEIRRAKGRVLLPPASIVSAAVRLESMVCRSHAATIEE